MLAVALMTARAGRCAIRQLDGPARIEISSDRAATIAMGWPDERGREVSRGIAIRFLFAWPNITKNDKYILTIAAAISIFDKS
jgi:hypothetical protein